MKSPYLGALALTAVVAGLTGAFIGLDKYVKHLETEAHLAAIEERMIRDEPSPFLDTPLSGLEDWEVNCATVDGGAATLLTTDIDGGAHRTETVAVQSSSTTCVAVGGSGVAGNTGGSATTRGFRIGSGCTSGTSITVDARGAYCRSAGAAVKVQVGGGRR